MTLCGAIARHALIAAAVCAASLIGLLGEAAFAGDRPATLDRVVIIGASASDGFGAGVTVSHQGTTVKEGTTLRDVIDLSMDENPAVLVSYATRSMFLSPHSIGRDEVRHAIRERPTLLVAIDFLFWYLYGWEGADGAAFQSEEDRLASLEHGLAALDEVLRTTEAVVVVGDIPDLTQAHSTMLSVSQLPAVATIDAANARIAGWANTWRTERGRIVAVVPIHELSAAARAGTPTTFGGVAWTPETDGALIQEDRLHPSFEGLAATWARVLESARDAGARVGTAFSHDPRVHRDAICDRLRTDIEATNAIRARHNAAPDAARASP